MTGTQVGEYRIESPGRAGSGVTVFRAEQPALGRMVELHFCSAPADSDAGRRFREQARRVAGLDHPNLLPVYEVAVVDGRVFAVMRERPGRRLDAILAADGALSPERAVHVADQLAPALETLTEAGMAVGAIPLSSVAIVDEAGGERAYLAPLELLDETAAGAPSATSSDRGTLSAAELATLLTSMLSGSAKSEGGIDTVPPQLRPVIERAFRPDGGYSSPSLLVEDASRGLGSETARHRVGRGRVAILVLAALALIGAAVAAVVILADEPSSEATAAPSADTPAGRIVARIPLGGAPRSLTVGNGSVWVARADGTVVRIDPRTNTVVGAPIRFSKPDKESNLTVRAGEGAIWALDGTAGTLTRIDPERGRVSGRIDLGEGLDGATVAGGVVWVTRSTPEGVVPQRHELLRVDPARLQVIGKPVPVGQYPLDIDASGDTAWVTNAGNGTITRVENGRTTTILVGAQPIASALHGELLWVPDRFGNTITPIHARSMTVRGEVVRIPSPIALATTPDAVWATALASNSRTAPTVLYRLDPAAHKVTGRPVLLGPDIGWIAAGEGAIWAPSQAKNVLLKVVPTVPAPKPREEPSAVGSPRRLLSGPLAPGTWRDSSFVVPYTVEIPGQGWLALGPDQTFIQLGRMADPDTGVVVAAPVQVYRPNGGIAQARTVDQVIGILRSNPHLVFGQLKRVMIGGRKAVQLSVRVRPYEGYPSFCDETCVALFGGPQTTFFVEESVPARIALLRRGGHVLAVVEQGGKQGSFAETEPVARSLRFD